MTVSCDYCGQEWPRGPALEVACPHCGSRVGAGCKRPSGHRGHFVGFCRARLEEAMRLGLERPCPASGRRPRADVQQPTLFEGVKP